MSSFLPRKYSDRLMREATWSTSYIEATELHSPARWRETLCRELQPPQSSAQSPRTASDLLTRSPAFRQSVGVQHSGKPLVSTPIEGYWAPSSSPHRSRGSAMTHREMIEQETAMAGSGEVCLPTNLPQHLRDFDEMMADEAELGR